MKKQKAKPKKKNKKNKSAGLIRKEVTNMAGPTPAELQAKLDAALQAVTDAKPGVDSAVALITSQRATIADLIKNAPDLTAAAATVDQFLAAQQAQKQELADALVAPGTP